MKKIVIVCDGKNFPAGAFEFVKLLHQHEPLLLVGSFNHSVSYPQLVSIESGTASEMLLAITDEYLDARTEAIKHFKQHCQDYKIEYRVHEETPTWNIDDLIKESRFADLFVMSEESFYADLEAEQPNSFLQQVMHHAECPVLVVPENFKSFERIVITYDGKKQSMFAMKEFCNLFPQFSNLETKIIFVKEDDNDEIPDMVYLQEYAGRHFSDLRIEKLHFNSQKYFDTWVDEEKDPLIISGSYARSGFSTSLKKSFVQEVIQHHSLPVFIAHTT